MPLNDEDILNACLPILQNNAKITESQDRCFLTAYQIWIRLISQGHRICGDLRNSYGDGVGAGAGAHVGPAQRMAQALARSPVVEKFYIDTMYLWFEPPHGGGFGPSQLYCGIFRLRERVID